jgi:hypothetical protein
MPGTDSAFVAKAADPSNSLHDFAIFICYDNKQYKEGMAPGFVSPSYASDPSLE